MMDSNIAIALITSSGAVLIAALTYYLTKKQQIAKEWREAKINHYKQLLCSISSLAVDGEDKSKANIEFSHAANTLALVAPQYVLTALMKFHDEVKFSNKNRSPEKHDMYLNELLLAIRKDIKISIKDDPHTFKFHLIGSAPK